MSRPPLRVLLIDDDEDDCFIVRDLLSGIASTSYDFRWVNSYQAALEAVDEGWHDVCLLDFHLGEHTGLDILRELTRRGHSKPIIFLTGQGDYDVDLEAMALGAADYLVKDGMAALLLDRSIRYAIERKRSEEKLKSTLAKLRQSNERLSSTLDELRAAEKEIVKANVMLRTVFNGISDPLFVVEKGLTVRVLNEAAHKYFRISTDDEAIGKTCCDLSPGKCGPCDDCSIRSAVEEGRNITLERKGLFDRERLEQVTVYPAEQVFDEASGAIIRISDVTEARNLEKHLMREDRLSSLGQLSGGIAHEIRNPMTGISLFVDILNDEEKFHRTGRERSILEEIRNNVKRIDGIIKRVLNLSKQSSGTLNPLSVNPLIEDTVRLWRSRLSNDGIQLSVSLEKDLAPILADSIEIQQVLNNLIRNAIEAMSEKGMLSITTQNGALSLDRKRSAVVIKIADSGPGIPLGLQKNIFNPYFTTKSAGTGLGLAISHRIVTRHGGILSFESILHEGTTFTVELPSASTDCISSDEAAGKIRP